MDLVVWYPTQDSKTARGSAPHAADKDERPKMSMPLTANQLPIASPDLAKKVSMKTVDLYRSCFFNTVNMVSRAGLLNQYSKTLNIQTTTNTVVNTGNVA